MYGAARNESRPLVPGGSASSAQIRRGNAGVDADEFNPFLHPSTPVSSNRSQPFPSSQTYPNSVEASGPREIIPIVIAPPSSAPVDGYDAVRGNGERDPGVAVVPPRKLPNWPRCCPMLFHDISVDVPTEEKRKTVRLAFLLWNLLFFTLIFDVFALMLGWVLDDSSGDGAKRFGLGFAYWLMTPIFSWFAWYKPLYNVTKYIRSWKYSYFLFNEGLLLVFVLILTIGVPSIGMVGFVGMIQWFQAGQGFLGFLFLIGALKNGGLSFLATWVWIRVFKYIRGLKSSDSSSGAPSIDVNQAETIVRVAGAIASNPAARSAVSQAYSNAYSS